LALDKEKKVNISLVLVQYESILRKAADMVSSDRITTYIGTYTRRESFVDGKAEGIYIYHLDLSSGESSTFDLGMDCGLNRRRMHCDRSLKLGSYYRHI
jgi:hypothetical protein